MGLKIVIRAVHCEELKLWSVIVPYPGHTHLLFEHVENILLKTGSAVAQW